MRIPDENLAEVFDRGFTLVEGFLDKATLADAREGLWDIYPRPEAYFADPAAYPDYAQSQFAGLRFFPYPSWALNRVGRLSGPRVDAAERFLQTKEIDCYKIELWAKYAGYAIDYDQVHHRDYRKPHHRVVPRADQLMPQMTCFILLSDVTELDGPTKAVTLDKTRHIPLGITQTNMGEFWQDEVSITGPAGSILIYKTDVFHRGSNFKAPGRSRFVMPVDFKVRGWRWQGKLAWPDRTLNPGWKEAMVRMTPRERDLFGWPPAGDPYWNAPDPQRRGAAHTRASTSGPTLGRAGERRPSRPSGRGWSGGPPSAHPRRACATASGPRPGEHRMASAPMETALTAIARCPPPRHGGGGGDPGRERQRRRTPGGHGFVQGVAPGRSSSARGQWARSAAAS